MRINEHNLDSLRKLIRDLQQENESLKTLLSEHNIPYEDRMYWKNNPGTEE